MRALLIALTFSLLVPPIQAQKSSTRFKKVSGVERNTLDARERALQMLNRFTYGPLPGDIEHVLAITPEKWFEQQLNPDSISDDTLNRRLAAYAVLNLAPDKALDVFPDRTILQQILDGKHRPPANPLEASVFDVQLYALKAQLLANKNPPPEPTEEEKAAKKKQDQATASRIADQLLALPKNRRIATLIQLPIPDRIAYVDNVPAYQRDALLPDFTQRELEIIYGMQGRIGTPEQIGIELAQAKVLRSILSERQLQEVMTDFWFNHFNVYMPIDAEQWYTATFERDTIRSHALGKFRDLLIATAESPAMMLYLDNWVSVGPNSSANAVNTANPKSKAGKQGLNENYGREVMELHTVGVNGGYTQADVTQLAAILTGWSVDKPQQGGPFLYDPRKHEPGTKQWFGYTIDDAGRMLSAAPGKPTLSTMPTLPTELNVVHTSSTTVGSSLITTSTPPDGMKQGITALTLLAASPKTAHYISYLLAQRFLADDPPPQVVDRMAASYLSSDGDIKTVLRALVSSPEFNQRRFFRNKVKTPIEFIASAFRTTATDPQNPGAIVNVLKNMGQPLYSVIPPNGYPITADHWMNTSALVNRLNFADQLTHNHFYDQKFDASRVLAFGLMALPSNSWPRPSNFTNALSSATPSANGLDMTLSLAERTIIGVPLSKSSEAFIRNQISQRSSNNPSDTLTLLITLILGSPDFQFR